MSLGIQTTLGFPVEASGPSQPCYCPAGVSLRAGKPAQKPAWWKPTSQLLLDTVRSGGSARSWSRSPHPPDHHSCPVHAGSLRLARLRDRRKDEETEEILGPPDHNSHLRMGLRPSLSHDALQRPSLQYVEQPRRTGNRKGDRGR